VLLETSSRLPVEPTPTLSRIDLTRHTVNQVTSRSSSGNQVVRSVSVEHSHVMELGLLSLTFILPETTLVAMLRTFYRHCKVAELQELHHLLTSTDQCRQELMVGI
jgi:hypothetical protein